MLKHIADLSGNYEYFLGWCGQSTSGSWGTPAEVYELFNDLELDPNGIDVTGLTTTGAAVGTIETGLACTFPGTVAANQFVGAHIRLGTTSSPIAGYGLIVAHTTTTVDVQWLVIAPAGSGQAGIVTFEDHRWSFRPNVRVLTPYQPTADDTALRYVPYPDVTATIANGGRGVALGGNFVTPAGVSHERSAALLEWTMEEGIDSYGISDANAGGAATAAAATTFSFTTATVVNYFTNGFLRVDWYDSGEAKVSYSRIGANTANQFTGLSWTGDGTPTGTAADWRWTAWVPHYNNNPWSYAPGEGYDYPNCEMRPCWESGNGAVIHNRPRGKTANAYGNRFGDMVIAASRISMATGKRINVVQLPVNAAGLAPVSVRNSFQFDGVIGWYDQNAAGTWAPSVPDSNFSRLDTLLRYCLPNAMTAEGNTKTPKFLAWFYSQGETDALSPSMRLQYRDSLRGLKAAIRNTIKGLGYSPYRDGVDVPWIQAKVMTVAYELKGEFTYYSATETFDGDSESLVNNAIYEENAGDEFADVIWTDDLPRKVPDLNHLNGVGEAARAMRISKRMAELIDHALGFGSETLTSEDSTIALYNRALSLIGQAPDVTAGDGSEQLRLCELHAPECRDTLLQMRQWSFALRRVALTEVKMPQQTLYTQYGHCYVMPPEALNGFRVLPPDEIEEPFDVLLVAQEDPSGNPFANPYSDAFVAAWDEGLAKSTAIEPGSVDPTTLPLVDEGALEPQVFNLERSPHGGRYIFTNQEQATLQYVERVSDASEWSSSFQEAFCAYLGSKLAGSLVKGKEGERVAAMLLQKAAGYVRVASSSEGIQRKPNKGPFDFVPDHLANR